jgi:hypothetical protein
MLFTAIFPLLVRPFCPAPAEIPSLVPRTRIYCQNSCTGGLFDINVSYCIFSGVTEANGGAIYAYGTSTRVFICHTHFYQCVASYSYGGAVRVYDSSVAYLFSVFATSCTAASSGAVADLSVDGAGTTCEVLETTALQNSCLYSTIAVVFTGDERSGIGRFSNLNFSSNVAPTRATALGFGAHIPMTVAFCAFHSNYPSSTFRISSFASATQSRDVCRCLYFVNNTATTDHFLYVLCHLLVSDSVFVQNRFTEMIGTIVGEEASVTFQDCAFDAADFEKTASLPVLTFLCDIRPIAEINTDVGQCPAVGRSPFPSRSFVASFVFTASAQWAGSGHPGRSGQFGQSRGVGGSSGFAASGPLPTPLDPTACFTRSGRYAHFQRRILVTFGLMLLL